MTLAALGVELTGIANFDRGASTLDKFASASNRAGVAADGLSNKADKAAGSVGRMFGAESGAARYAQQIDQSSRSLSGFGAVAARAAVQAEYVTRQIERMSAHEIRDTEIQEYGQELDRLRAKFNPLFAAQQRFQAATMEINRAQQVGALSAREASAAIQREEAALRSATAALTENTQAANDNRIATVSRSAPGLGRSNFNTANVAAQFQDIAVTSAMGMSPLQIALQQGTQLSAVLGGQGLTGVVRTLGAAFASILSPVSLLTIGAVALGAVGLQALGNMFQGAEDATSALERHNEALDETLAGYNKVREAADSALDAALKLPERSVQSDLGAQRAEAANRAVAAMEKALQLRQEFEGYANYAEAFNVPEDVAASLENINSIISEITADSALSKQELDLLHSSLTELGNNTADQNIKAISAEALALVDAARQAFAQVDSLDTALRNIPRDVQIRLQVSQEFTSSMSELGDLYVDPRNRFEVAREQAKNLAEQASATASSYGDLVGVGKEYERVLSSIDAAEAEAGKKSAARGASAAAKPFNQWESATESFQQRIDQQRMEIGLIGESTYEIERQRAAFDLLNQAKKAGIPITSEVTAQINSMSAEYAAAAVEVERMQALQVKTFDVSLQLASSLQGIGSGLVSAFTQGGNAMTNVLDMIINKLSQFASAWLDNIINNGLNSLFSGGLGNIFGGGMSSGMPGTSSITGSSGGYFPGFDGGGYTGSGGRYGGLDGKGGFLAMMHPQETVIDHTRGQAANQNQRPQVSFSTNIINNAGVEVVERSSDDGQGGVRQEIVLNRAVANAIGKPGPAQRAVRQTGRLVTR